MKDFFPNILMSRSLKYEKDILLLDEFSGSMNWTKEPGGCVGLVEHSNDAAFIGTNGLRITTYDLSPHIDDVNSGNKSFGFPKSSNIRLQCMFSTPDVSKVSLIYFIFDVSNGTRRYRARINIAPHTGVVQYFNQYGGYNTIGEIVLYLGSGQWCNFNLDIDKDSFIYKSIGIDSQRYEFGNDDMRDFAAATSRVITLKCCVVNKLDDISELYIDNCMVCGCSDGVI